MKRTAFVVAAFLAAFSAFADEDEDRVLAEARRRAERDRQNTEEAREAAEEAREAVAEAREEIREAFREARGNDEDDLFLPLALSILPGSPVPGRNVDATVGLGLIISGLDDVYGMQASTIGSVAEGSVNGLQAAGIFSTSEGEVAGAQFAGVFNVAEKRVGGFQGAGVFNVAEGDVAGFQSAGVFNVAEGYVGGGQSAGVFNIAGEGGPVQLAGVFNISGGGFSGFQAAGVFNIAEDIDGVQTAGVFNVADDVRGFQVGVVNVADTVFGLQIGLVNIVVNGISDMGAWVDERGDAFAFMQRGTSNFYTLIFAGAPRYEWFKTDENLMGGVGFGTRVGGSRRWEPALDFDVSAKARIDRAAIEDAIETETRYFPSVFPSFRASVRLPIGIGFALHGGWVLDAEYEGGNAVPDELRESDAWSKDFFGAQWTFHPKLFLGLSI